VDRLSLNAADHSRWNRPVRSTR